MYISISSYTYTYRYIHIHINIYIHTSSTATTTMTHPHIHRGGGGTRNQRKSAASETSRAPPQPHNHRGGGDHDPSTGGGGGGGRRCTIYTVCSIHPQDTGHVPFASLRQPVLCNKKDFWSHWKHACFLDLEPTQKFISMFYSQGEQFTSSMRATNKNPYLTWTMKSWLVNDGILIITDFISFHPLYTANSQFYFMGSCRFFCVYFLLCAL